VTTPDVVKAIALILMYGDITESEMRYEFTENGLGHVNANYLLMMGYLRQVGRKANKWENIVSVYQITEKGKDLLR